MVSTRSKVYDEVPDRDDFIKVLYQQLSRLGVLTSNNQRTATLVKLHHAGLYGLFNKPFKRPRVLECGDALYIQRIIMSSNG